MKMKKLTLICLILLMMTVCLSANADSDHNFGPWVTLREPTCSSEGHQKRYCRDCDHWEQREIKKLPHTVESWEVTKEPTCTEEGVRVATCQVCGAFLRVKIEKLGHDYVASNPVKAPTCTAPGRGDMVCTRCGKIKKDTTIPRLEHEWSEWVVVTEPGKTKGVREHTCQLCGKTEKNKFYYEGTLYEGMSSDFSVIQLQVMLRDLGYYSGNIQSGSFGSLTGKAVAAFQKANQLPATEVADPNTILAIRQQWEARTGRSMDDITTEDTVNK
ncbi:MAG: peptidoglycan-binding protein [Clostridia bacterium]|nr:peptidoglycan-binding protein [Clostridia bacterium]